MIIAAVAAAFANCADESAEAIKTLLNTSGSVPPAKYEQAAKIVARDAANGKLLQMYVTGLLSREKNAPKALRISAAKRQEYMDASREKIKNLARLRNNALAYYLLAMETNDLDLLRKAADNGNVQAMNAYATIYLNQAMSGRASTNAVENAMRIGYDYFSKAAALNDANGLYNLGMCYMRGYVVEPDPEKARECFLAAAKQDHPEAINNIGGFYRDGITLEPDPIKAARWFAKSADLGNPYGQLNYALALLRGEGVVRDEDRAVRMLQASAQGGNAEAMNILGECYHGGIGVPRDVKTAIRLYRKAADAGLPAAMDNYADCYENGDGIPKNQEAANIWHMKARAVRGDRSAAAWLDQMGVK